jgi:hypothetical protein
MTWRPTEGRIIPQAIADTSTTKKLPLGTIVHAEDETYGAGEFIYLLGVASTAVASWVRYLPDDYSTALLVAGHRGSVAIAMSANVASQYGWYQIRGKAVGKVLAAFADNGAVYATSTAGSIDDAVVGGDLVKNALGASAIDTPSTGLAEIEIDRPFMDGADAGIAPVVGVAAGYKIARSAAPVALDGSNPTSVAHGLTTCVAAVAQLAGSSAPGDSTAVLTCVINGAAIDVYAWKHQDGTDPTFVASTGTETFNWIAIGT